ncbi:histidine kinase [Winogradskyella tangerina]|uniref:histidine kinase n=1 Tax=Winogradskyella tangerina TaxID=2023240 RepID=UPI000DBE39CA|nr:histidine kinase [Winogradskyella tangerina]
MRHFLTILTFICLLFCCSCNVDNEISRIIYLQEKAKNNVNDSTLTYIKEAQDIIDKGVNIPDTLITENIFRKGRYFKKINELDSASYYYHLVTDRIEAPNNRARNLVYFRNTWETDEALRNYKNAIATILKFIEITDPEKRQGDVQFAYNTLQRLYYDLGNSKKELEYSNLASNAALLADDLSMYVVTKSHSAYILARDYYKPKEALILLDSLDTIDASDAAKYQLYRNTGIAHYYDANLNEAINFYKRSLSLAKEVEVNRDNNLLEAYSNIAEAYIDVKEYDKAKKHLDSAKVYITPNSPTSTLNFFYSLLLNLNEKTNSDKENLANQFKSLIKISNQQYEKRINQELFDLKLANASEQKALNERNTARINNLKLWAALGVLALLVLSGYLYYRQRQFKFERESLQMQQRLLRSQMNPHFIFNTLSVIQNQVKENKDDAVNYLIKFSRLLRLILENSLSDYVELEDEIESLRKYLDLQLFRFPNKFEYHIELANIEDESEFLIPPMLIQPFVENSIEHGFLDLNYKGQLRINLSLDDKWISCKIEDNGVGINNSNSKLKNSVSVKLISRFLKKTTKQDLRVTNKKDIDPNTSGVLVEFLIPFK